MHSITWTTYLSLFVSALFYIVEPCPLHAQHKPLLFEHYSSSASGLARTATLDMIQDSHGFLWFGTEKGLQRYDGVHSISYRHDPLDSTSITLDFINYLIEDADGMIWAIGFNRIMRFNPRLETADNFQTGPLKELASNRSILCITADTKKGIWIGTDKGLSHYSFAENRIVDYSAIPTGDEVIEITDVHSVVSDYHGSVWFNVSDKGVARLTPGNNTIDYFDHQADSSIFPREAISPILASPDGTVWFGTSSGLIQYNSDSAQFESIPLLTDNLQITTAALGKDNDLWIGTANQGMIHYDYTTHSITSYTHDPDNNTSINPGLIYKIIKDKSDVLWVVTPSAISKADLNRKPFNSYQHTPSDPNSLTNNMVLGITEELDGALWVATAHGLNRKLPGSNEFLHYINEGNDGVSISHNEVWTVHSDHAGHIWSGSVFSEIIDVRDPKTDSFAHFERGEDSTSYQGGGTFYVYEDLSNTIWIGSEWGLSLYNSENNRFSLHTPKKDKRFPVRAIYEDRTGLLWVGTEGSGLFSFNKKTQAFTHFPHTSSTDVFENQVYSILEDHRGWLWFGTNRGLFRLIRNPDGQPTGEFRHYTTSDGLSGNSVVGLLEDDLHRIWASTSTAGLTCINITNASKEEMKFRTYDTDDGLPSNTFFIGPTFKNSDGIFYFGTDNGLLEFNPLEIHDNPIPPQPEIVDFELFNTSLPIGPLEDTERILLTQGIPYTSEVELSYQDRVFSILFAGLHYAAPHKNEYEYRLTGFSDEWQSAGSESQATYTNLDPGKYTFEVRSANSDGLWNQTPETLTIVITPPFWQTGWFRFLLVLSSFSLIFSWNHWRTRTIRVRNQTLAREVELQTKEIRKKNDQLSEAAEELRLINDNLQDSNQTLENRTDQLRQALEENKEILGITAHDLKNPLGGIIGLAEMVLQDIEKGAQATYVSASDNLPMLKDEAERMLNIIKNLLDKHREGEDITLNREQVILGDIVSSVIRWNAKQAQNKNITLNFRAEEVIIVEVDILSIQRALDNYVSNAIKYSPPESEVCISLNHVRRSDQNPNAFVKVAVCDKGPGLTEQDKQKVFGKMQRLSAKPTGGEHSTGLGLFIVKQLVEAHRGRVGVDSVYGEGSTFWFILPVCETSTPSLSKLFSSQR